MFVLALLAAAAMTPVELTDVCSTAIEASNQSTDPKIMEVLFVSQIELKLSKTQMSQDEKQFARFVCGSYHSGYVKGLSDAVALVEGTRTAGR